MAKTYFRNVPDFNYVSRLEGEKNISEYLRVKNLFKRVRINESLFNDLTYFTKYKVVNDERPDQVAYKIYGTQDYDWIVLLSNNIVNFQSEWPLSNESFEKYMFSKYGSEDKFYTVHHYETKEIRDSNGRLILPGGLTVDQGFTIPDPNSPLQDLDPTVAVTNWLVETRKNNEKRAIQVLRPQYVNQLIDDANDILEYQESSQFTEDSGKIAFNDLIQISASSSATVVAASIVE